MRVPFIIGQGQFLHIFFIVHLLHGGFVVVVWVGFTVIVTVIAGRVTAGMVTGGSVVVETGNVIVIVDMTGGSSI